MRVTIKTTSPTEAVILINAGNGQRLTLPVSIGDAPAAVWSGGRLEQVVPATEALRMLETTEQGFRAALCS